MFVSELPSMLVEDADIPIVEETGASDWLRAGCELRTPATLTERNPPSLHSHQVRDLLRSEQNTYDLLAAEYWTNTHVRRVIEEALATSENESEQLTNACLVAARVADASLWERLAARARNGHRVAEACLRNIPDKRGVAYFSAALQPDADVPLGIPLLSNALHFFVVNCTDQALNYLASALGNPFIKRAGTRAAKYGRLVIGRVLRQVEESEEILVRDEWCDYVAACLLTEDFNLDEGWGNSDGLALLRAHNDPRTPVVMHRLIRDRQYDEEDVVPSLTVVTSVEAMVATRELLAETIAARREARGDEANRLEWLEELLRSAAKDLGIDAIEIESGA